MLYAFDLLELNGEDLRPRPLSSPHLTWSSLQLGYLTIRYMLTPNPLGHTLWLISLTYLVVTGTTTAPHASAGVAKKAPLQTNPSQTPAPSLAKT
jgi:hypothetical protein